MQKSKMGGGLHKVALYPVGLKDGFKKSPTKAEDFTCGLSSKVTLVVLVANTGNQISLLVGIRGSLVQRHELTV